MLTLTSSQAQNSFGRVIDKAQREAVSVTRHGQVVSLIMSPEVLEEYVEARLALEAKNRGMLSAEQSKSILDEFR
ncbi:hypothetical protein B0181_10335 [Moraxella caviae]|uniref:Antitoxin n=1 Tax=Moraxella caviae TaxID=34060 RepID=A0A1S9ZV65_9GAMM|nr:type II toxin-antitoxin system Phd/YefM family antitoxin [Moraxella caviae]OOR87388.1 hypothetical protein B0181_10335 [Moraxella caviae]STZ10389.1 Phd_YefM [Moraxella caviae]